MNMSSLKHAVAAILLLPCLVGAGLADERGHDRGRHVAPRPAWHGEIARFHEHDSGVWRGGRWHRGRHDGRLGWWWIVAGSWYFYPTRLDTYPDPYQPPVVLVPQAPSPTRYWYYCTNPAGYYPYIAQCAVDWKRVPATVPPR
jgi:hypothetical protein